MLNYFTARITLNFDTNTPHPRGVYRIQGTKGVFTKSRKLGVPKIYLDGITQEEHEWEEAEKYLKEYEHPILKNYNQPERKVLRGHGYQATQTLNTWHR